MANEKIVFMGSPDYAVPILEMLNQNYRVTGVITQPDRPVGRGKKIQPPPVKTLAQSLGLPIMQPVKIKSDEFIQELSGLDPDVIIVAAYGKILTKKILELPRSGCVNVHASLLPKWRGASPIQSAILNGDTGTGVTIMLMDEGVDTGKILAQSEVMIEEQDTAESLSKRLSVSGADLLKTTLPDYLSGGIQPQTQNEKEATFTRMLKKEDGKIDFSQRLELIERQVRAYYPWPICYFNWDDSSLRVIEAEDNQTRKLACGQRGILGKYPCIGTASGDLKLVQVQPSGKRVMSGKDFLNGARNWES